MIDIFCGTNRKEILVNIWVKETLLQETQENIKELDDIKYSNLNGMPGVARSNWIKWVKDDTIFD